MASSKIETVKTSSYYVDKIFKLMSIEDKKNPKRYTLYPVVDPESFAFYQKQENIHWTAQELDFTADVAQYQAASPAIRKILDTILAFFLAADGAISDNISFRFLLESNTYEDRAFFISQNHIELVHAETYGLAALTFKRDVQALTELIVMMQQLPCVTRKIDFIEKWTISDRPAYQRFLAFACAEGIFFCTLFAVIFWFRSKGLFSNFVEANEMISRDESLHRDYQAFRYRREVNSLLANNCDEDEIIKISHQIIDEAIDVEDEFIDYILSSNLEDLNAKDLKIYARTIADNLLAEVSTPLKFNVKNPFTWLNDISMNQKTNFYERKALAYTKSSLSTVLDWKTRTGLSDEKKGEIHTRLNEIDF